MMISLLMFFLLGNVRIEEALLEKLNKMGDTERIGVIVVMRNGYDLSKFREDDYDGKREYMKKFAQESQKPIIDYLSSIGETEGLIQYFVINGFAVKLPKAVILELSRREDVGYIQEDRYTRLIPEDRQSYQILDTYPTGDEEIPWDKQLMNAHKVWDELGHRGGGIVIGIMDTGVDVTHPCLKDNWRGIRGWFDAVNGRSYPYDDEGHGTACASLMCGRFNIGVAPDAKFIAVKILDNQGSGTLSNILNGFNWIAGLPDSLKPRVVSNSWGLSSWNDATFFTACSTWKALGIFPIFAAGNSGSNVTAQSVPGTYPTVLSVGATDPDDRILSYSSRGGAPNLARWNNTYNWYSPDWNRHKPDVVAPADPVVAAAPGGKYIRGFNGTSSATPHVAGEAALILSRNPYLNLSQLYLTIRNNTKLIDHVRYDYPNDTTGWGRVDAYRAVINTPLPSNPNLVIWGVELDDRTGNADRGLQPGERIYLKVKLKNLGGYASTVSASLVFDTIPDAGRFVTYHLSSVNLGSMGTNEERDAIFDMTLSSLAPYDQQLHFTLKVVADLRTQYLFFNIPVTTVTYPAQTETIQYDNNTPYYNPSNDGTYANYNYFATRFETASPCSLKAIAVYFAGTATNETLFVWKHDKIYNAPSSVIYGYTLINVPSANTWQTINLTNPIYISEPGYFWVGIRKASASAVPYQDNDGASTRNLSSNDRTNPASWWGASYWYDFCWRVTIKRDPITTPWIFKVVSYRIDDSFYGNNNGYIDPGERVALRVSLKNLGITAENTVGTLFPVGATQDSVIILKETAFFGTVYNGEGGNNNDDPFIIEFTSMSGLSGFAPEFMLVLRYNYGSDLREEKEDTVFFEITGPFVTLPNVYYWYPMGSGGGDLISGYPNGTYYWATFAPFSYGVGDSIWVDSVAVYGYNNSNQEKNMYFYIWAHNPSTGRPSGSPIYTSAAISVPAGDNKFFYVRPNIKIPAIFWYGQNSDITASGRGLKPPIWFSKFIGQHTLVNSSNSNWSSIYGWTDYPLFVYMKIAHAHPTLSYHIPAGWVNPIVVSNTNSTIPPEIIFEDTVYVSGWVALNRSTVSANIPSGYTMRNIMFLDNYGLATVSLTGPATLNPWNYIYYSGYQTNVPAGRHTFYYVIDWDNVVPSNATNRYLRYWGQQFAIAPVGYLPYNIAVQGGYAPPMYGPGSGYRFNTRTFRIKTLQNQWIAVVVRNSLFGASGDSIDLDLRIYEDGPSSPHDGFEKAVAQSSLGPDKMDFIVVWGSEEKDIYPGVHSFGETRDSFEIVVAKSVYGYLNLGGGGTVDITLPSSSFAYIENFIIAEGTKASITVDIPSGNADIALYLFSKKNTPGDYRNPIQYVAFSDTNGIGGSETVTYTPLVTDTVALLVIKKSGSGSEYTLRFNNVTILPVEDNQYLSLNRISYAIPAVSKVTGSIKVVSPTLLPLRIRLIDVQGREVSVLYEGFLKGGSHEIRLPEGLKFGIYYVEVSTGNNKRLHRMIVVK
ncbi:MAG: S8 family serine peptidase [candidate division WOR-3 bacterium]